MQNPNDVTTQAFDGLVREIAIELGITDKRVYEILGNDNPYPKLWRLLNPLGRLNADRLELIRADFNARCDRITRGCNQPSTIVTLTRELHDVIEHVLERRPHAERREAINEAIVELYKQLQLCGGAE